MKRVILLLLVFVNIVFANVVVETNDGLRIVSDIEAINKKINSRIEQLNLNGVTNVTSDSAIKVLKEEKISLLSQLIESFKSGKFTVVLDDKEIKKLSDNTDHNKDEKYTHAYYRDLLELKKYQYDEIFSELIEYFKDFDFTKSKIVDLNKEIQTVISSINSDSIDNKIIIFIEKYKDDMNIKYKAIRDRYEELNSRKKAYIDIYNYILKNTNYMYSQNEFIDAKLLSSLKSSVRNNYIDSNDTYEIVLFSYDDKIEGEDNYVVRELKIDRATLYILLFLFLLLPINIPLIFFKIPLPGKLVFWIPNKILEKVSLWYYRKNTTSKFIGDRKGIIHSVFESLSTPLVWFYSVLITHGMLLISFAPNKIPENFDIYIFNAHLFTFVWIIWNILTNFHDSLVNVIKKKNSKITTEGITFLVFTAKSAVAIIFISIFIWSTIPNVVNYFAGLGFLIAFILKENLSDYFNTSKVIKELNIQVGHWVLLTKSNVQGDIDNIGIFFTRIIGFDGSSITIPTSDLAKEIVLNFSRRETRQIKFKFNIPLSTPFDTANKIIKEIHNFLQSFDKLRHSNDEDLIELKNKYINEFINRIPHLKKDNSEIKKDAKDAGELKFSKELRTRGLKTTCFAYWTDTEDTLSGLVYCNTKEDNWDFQLLARQEIILEIMKIVQSHDINLVGKSQDINFSQMAKLFNGLPPIGQK